MAAVSSAVNLIKKAKATVDDVRSLGPLLGQYFDAKHTAVKAIKEAKKEGGSNLARAIEIEMALKEQADFERELNHLFFATNNMDVWTAIQDRVAQMNREDAIAERRAIEAERKRRRKVQEFVEASIAAAILVVVGVGLIWVVMHVVDYCKTVGCRL